MRHGCDTLKNRAFATSSVLLMLALVAIPGYTFYISSSVTSYNNTITFTESGGGEIPGMTPSGNFNIDKNANPELDGGYEIKTNANKYFSEGSLGLINIKVDSNCKVRLYVEIDNTGSAVISINGVETGHSITQSTGKGYISVENTLIAQPDDSPGAWTASLNAGDTMTIFGIGSTYMRIALVFV